MKAVAKTGVEVQGNNATCAWAWHRREHYTGIWTDTQAADNGVILLDHAGSNHGAASRCILKICLRTSLSSRI